VRTVRHVIRLLWGDDLDDALRPVLGVTLVGSAAGSAMWSFVAIWAVDELGAKAALPFALLVGAILSALSGFGGGYLSDRIGRRRVILIGNGVMVAYPLVLLALSNEKWAGLGRLRLPAPSGRSEARSRRQWWPTSWRPSAARAPTRPSASPRTWGSSSGRRSEGCFSSLAGGRRSSRAWLSSPRWRGSWPTATSLVAVRSR
jgi:MFS family permease